MKQKILLIIILTISSYCQLHSQQQTPDLLIPITITFDYPPYPPPYSGTLLEIGLDSTATNGLDLHLGEFELPPVPPPGHPAVLFLPAGNWNEIAVSRDIRFGELPFTGAREHRIRFMSNSGATIHWNLPLGTSGLLQDLFGGIIINVPLLDSGSYYVSNFAIDRLKILLNYNNVGGNPIPGPVFMMHPTTINFGEVAFGQSETAPVFIFNTGYQDSLIITDVVSSSQSFTFEPNSFPIILPPGQIQAFDITYTGISGGEHIDSILFTNNAPGSPHKLNVRATTYDPNPNCEAQILFEILVTDNVAPIPRILIFGLDSTATDEIDPQLGEYGPLPPFPPPGAFEAQWFLPENNFSGSLSAYCDFRNAIFPFTGQKEWRLAYQADFGANITISWEFPEYITGTLQDIVNGTFINVPMSDSGSYIVTDPIIFNRLRMLIDFNISLPVELTSFTASILQNEKVIQLNWTTATEANNSGFEIQRQVGSRQSPVGNWMSIGFVPGFGISTEPKTYSFIDENVISGTYKYRLKQIDFDGSFEYSNEIEVEVDFTPNEFILYQNYPNPFNPSTTIKFEIPEVETTRRVVFTTLKVYDILGNEVATLENEEKQPGVYEVEFDAQTLSSGIYIYKLQAGTFAQAKKMVLMR